MRSWLASTKLEILAGQAHGKKGKTSRSVGTTGWDGLVWRLKYPNAMLCVSRGQLVDL